MVSFSENKIAYRFQFLPQDLFAKATQKRPQSTLRGGLSRPVIISHLWQGDKEHNWGTHRESLNAQGFWNISHKKKNEILTI